MLMVDDIQMTTKGKFLQYDKNYGIQNIVIDSRKVKKGCAFIAIVGERLDGHRFIKMAVQKGAKLIIVSEDVICPKEVTVLKVKDTTKAYGDIARLYRQKFDLPIVVITGSAGKTTTKEMIAQVLETKYSVLKNERSENNQYGVPMTLLKLKPSHQIAVLELGTNQIGDIDYLSGIVQPTIAIFTNIGESHLCGLKTVNGVLKEKLSIIKYLSPSGTIIYNNDDPYLFESIDSKPMQQEKKSYAMNRVATYMGKYVPTQKSLHMTFKINGRSFCLPSLAQYHIYNVMASVACGQLFKITYRDMANALAKFQSTHGRQAYVFKSKTLIIDDTYNSNPISLRGAIQTLDLMKTCNRKILVCADMLELGKKSIQLHSDMASLIGASSIDETITFGEDSAYITSELKRMKASCQARHYKSIGALHKKLQTVCQQGDVILVKGSRGMRMERTVSFLKKLLHG